MTTPRIEPLSADDFQKLCEGHLPGLVGLQMVSAEQGRIQARLEVRPELLAPNGYLHAATVVALADTACGYGALRSRPEGSTGFTTIEIKTNFLGTVREGAIACDARLVHGGRNTQVWDAPVIDEASGKTIALFRCTQMILWPKGA